MRARLPIVICFLLLNAVSGCRFKMPTIEEQRELIKRNSLGEGTPDWLAKPVLEGNTDKREIGGLMPMSFGAPLSPNAIELSHAEVEQQARLAKARGSAKVDDVINPDSPLSRIDKLCPSLEAEVNAALLELETAQRINRYKTLTGKCSLSPDLWLWLAEDTYVAGDFEAAKQAVNKVLSLDPSNKQAHELSDKLGERVSPPTQQK